MNKLTVMLLFCSGVLLGLSGLFRFDELTPVYIAGIILVVIPFAFLYNLYHKRAESKARAETEAVKETQSIVYTRRELRSKIPKTPPRQNSQAAFEGSTKVGTARSMAMLIRKPRLREIVYELCDFADMILETIRRMPADTPAAVTFAEKHLSKFNQALEHCFEVGRLEKNIGADDALSGTDTQEMECFMTLISAFKKQQDYILFEGLKTSKG